MSAVQDIRIAPDKTATITSLTAVQLSAPSSVVRFSVAVDANVRSIRWYRRSGGSWPTKDNTAGGIPDPAFHTKEAHPIVRGGGMYQDGTAADGTLDETGETTRGGAAPTYANGVVVRVVAVPLDNEGNPGPQASLSYTLVAGAGADLTSSTWTGSGIGTSCSDQREYDFAWTPNAQVVNGTHDLKVYVRLNGTRTLLFTEASPASVTTRNNVDVPAYDDSGMFSVPIEAHFEYELIETAGPTIVATGQIDVTDDSFQGILCP